MTKRRLCFTRQYQSQNKRNSCTSEMHIVQRLLRGYTYLLIMHPISPVYNLHTRVVNEIWRVIIFIHSFPKVRNMPTRGERRRLILVYIITKLQSPLFTKWYASNMPCLVQKSPIECLYTYMIPMAPPAQLKYRLATRSRCQR